MAFFVHNKTLCITELYKVVFSSVPALNIYTDASRLFSVYSHITYGYIVHKQKRLWVDISALKCVI